MSGSLLFTAPTTGLTVNAGQVNLAPVTLGLYPREGGRSAGAVYDWTSQTAYTEDLSAFTFTDQETTVQSAWIDNTACQVTCTIYVPATGQTIIVPPGAQRMVPLIFSGAPQVTISVPISALGATRILWLNLPAPTVDYSGSSRFGAQAVNIAGAAPTFIASSGLLATGANPTTIGHIAFTSTLTNGKVATLKRVLFSADVAGFIQLNRRSTLATGGASSALVVSRSSNIYGPTNTSTTLMYTTPPTPGTLIATLAGAFHAASPGLITFDFTQFIGPEVAQIYTLDWTQAAGGNVQFSFIWTEE